MRNFSPRKLKGALVFNDVIIWFEETAIMDTPFAHPFASILVEFGDIIVHARATARKASGGTQDRSCAAARSIHLRPCRFNTATLKRCLTTSSITNGIPEDEMRPSSLASPNAFCFFRDLIGMKEAAAGTTVLKNHIILAAISRLSGILCLASRQCDENTCMALHKVLIIIDLKSTF